ncbi:MULTISPECIES: type II toxin-antitoxin system Phd/YefM family antitoxin [unclassified Streptomyces]|uniref:Antitoxin n=1 Tax=Streptomyces sp. NBC_00180 TaxID=2903632 RepID=A0AAU1I8S1_9ACTN|nr:type II toxin-antitoxin system prevent-host-death family antitoxin [Streptomyces sp. NBC_01017]WSV34785.1 type II toxin-antitoxin system prevent-host-death family antitoxin [Streptomyces sp. NBC_01017]
MEATAREFNQQSSALLAQAENGKLITVTKNGRPVARLVPIDHEDVPPHPTTPIGPIDLPEFDLGDPMSNQDMDEILRGMGQ